MATNDTSPPPAVPPGMLPAAEPSCASIQIDFDALGWSDDSGWSSPAPSAASPSPVTERGVEDDEEIPPTQRSPSGIRLVVEDGRPVAVVDIVSADLNFEEVLSAPISHVELAGDVDEVA